MPTITITTPANDAPGVAAVARVSAMDGTAIKTITVSTQGTLYRSATVAATGGASPGTGQTFSARIGPKGGHGSNAKTELGGVYVMMNVRLTGTEGGDFTVGDDFRKVILLANPLASAVAATASTYTGAEMDDDTGDMIYVEYRLPINRASDQTEDVKLVVEF